MDVSPILDPLNEEQREAVTSPPGHALVLAGAGSGKTRVLTHRIAWLCGVERLSPYSLVAVTFTNKAAQEMRARVEALLGLPAAGMWLGTFHGLCHRLLRMHWREAGLQQAFQVLDAEDQRRLVKRVIAELNLDAAQWPAKESQWFINEWKEKGVRPDGVQAEDHASRQLLRVYEAYEEIRRRAALVDFADLLLYTLEMFRENEALRKQYHERFRGILVDEFQDTNALQYAWLRLLTGAEASVFAVGDDDQSIYGWRGARVENILNFSKDFPDVTVYRLERNYRSTSTILAAANALIENNPGRLGKKLWTDCGEGEPLRLFAALNEQEEADFVTTRVREWVEQGGSGNEIAVLYRSNAQSRVVENALNARGIAYRVYGGPRFFERAVIKDALAYLRVAANPEDDQAYERVVNVPPRGIGERTLEQIRVAARERGVSPWRAGRALIEAQSLPARAAGALSRFHELVEKMSRGIRETALGESVERVVGASGMIEYYRRRDGEKDRSNVENLEEFIAAAEQFERSLVVEDGVTPLDSFLAHAALEAGERQASADEDCVQLMTLHSAKGLEFPLVIMTGMEENLFPHAMSLEEPGKLEEERRLCYVGITRARKQLVMSYAETRRRHGSETRNRLSRFVSEIPEELVEELRPRLHVAVPFTARRGGNGNESGVGVGSSVAHDKFGRGVVLDCEGVGASARVQVRFENAGVKWLVLAYANLKPL